MNAQDLSSKIDNILVGSGFTLSIEEKTALRSSLALLKSTNKFHEVHFWGKIFGITQDYLIAQGVGENFLEGRKSFVSHSGVEWVLLPELDQLTQELCKKVTGRFIGDLSHEAIVEVPSSTIKPGDDPNRKIKMGVSEEKRLSYTVNYMDSETSVVPRGALTLTATHTAIRNPTFSGLTSPQSTSLSSYCHVRNPITFHKKTLLQKEGLTKTLDFLDTIDEDLPTGCWGLTQDQCSQIVSIRSLNWPGYFFYAVEGTSNYGSCYFGFGEKNYDIGFQL
eukprot:TRINITY_DN1417_c0_g1_i1.p1 TRINITY_DN1417_c0_g1~~TRINITY_DN1417_c0_g1_i1.p1  ORF type:complete len:278 (+),score=56.15 TRINITY_DN1417_c0_g1_i1:614-1447(+)